MFNNVGIRYSEIKPQVLSFFTSGALLIEKVSKVLSISRSKASASNFKLGFKTCWGIWKVVCLGIEFLCKDLSERDAWKTKKSTQDKMNSGVNV